MGSSSPQGAGAQPAVKQALAEMRKLRARLDLAESAEREKIAIIGIGLRFPGGAVDASSYWKLLANGIDAISEIPADRWDVDAYYSDDQSENGKMTVRHGGFLEEVDRFDAEFFGVSPREAVSTDPQQRLLLEVAWEALENAALSANKLRGSNTGVFVAISNSDYGRWLVEDVESIEAHAGTGGSHAVAAGRISYTLGLQGPCIAVDTGCSGSLVALAQACTSLRRKECDVALAGGVNLILSPEMHVAFSKAGMLAVDGRCKTFDAEANGYVRSEGCGMLALKRLSDAERDGDPIVALVRSAEINQDGSSSGLTVPNGPAQEAVVRAALAQARVEPEQISFVETHGTGTSLGDPIEIHALGAVFGDNRPEDRKLLVGAVKSNIGHAEAAAGMAGVIKVALALRHGEIPPNIHFENPSPQIDWERCPFTVPTEMTAWPEGEGVRLAGVSSFGFSGTNAHVIMEEAPVRERSSHEAEQGARILCLSAKGDAPLRTLAKRYAEYLEQESLYLPDVIRSANIGRSHFSHRLAVTGSDQEELRHRLTGFAAGGEPDGCARGTTFDTDAPDVAFLFTGQGAQYVGMGRELYDREPAFKQAIDRCAELTQPYLEPSLLSVVFPDEDEYSPIGKTAYAQPVLFAIQYALAQLWASVGIRPAAVLGHSIGEYAAACVAGVLSLEDGLRLTAERGRLMQSTSADGAMAAVFAESSELSEALQSYSSRISIAAYNGPENTVLSGDAETLSKILAALEKKGFSHTRLDVSHAFHSPLIDPCMDEFASVCDTVAFGAPHTVFVSGSSGNAVGDEITKASYWVRQSREAVRFWQGMETLKQDGFNVFVEIGPHPTLLGMASSFWPTGDGAVFLPSVRRDRGAAEQFSESLGSLYVAGADIDWEGLHPKSDRPRLQLPTYPFQRDRYWFRADRRPRAARRHGANPWATVVQAARRQAGQVPIDMHLDSLAKKWICLDSLSQAYVVDVLDGLGAFSDSKSPITADSLIETGRVLPTYRMLVSRWLDWLAADGLIETTPDGYLSTGLPKVQTQKRLQEASQLLTDSPLLMEYIERCGKMLAPVLAGDDSALETLFPGGSGDTAEFLYRHWAVSRYFNGIVAAVVKSALGNRASSGPIRLIEIGAGTGSTTMSVLPELPPDQSLYVFTDVSDFFLGKAKDAFEEYPFVKYGLLNVEKSPAEQGYGKHSFDVVIAANVLHATKNLSETTEHVFSLLKPGGLLILYEVTRPPRWNDVTVGLIEGWQRFEDDLRTDSPLVPPGTWKSILQSCGFEDVESFPGEESPADVIGYNVIVARTPDTDAEVVDIADELFADVSAGEARGSTKNSGSAVDREAIAALRAQLESAPVNERRDLLVDYVRNRVNQVLRRDSNKPLDVRHRLMDLGVDSLMAVELRNRLGAGLGLEQSLSATLIFDYPTVDAIASYLSGELVTVSIGQGVFEAGEAKENVAKAITEDDVRELSEEEMQDLLLKRMDEL